MQQVTKKVPQFAEHMAGFIHEIFRGAGISMVATNAMERVRATGERMANAIEYAAERKAIMVAQRLQVAVSDGFTKLEAKLNDLNKRVEELEGDRGAKTMPPQ